ncbi:hypothetical protein F4811DRAFT_507079 [Daldinia bambusicola]|nr:hypothetical protein F4811DRAFT_507079 [Daldinia bambusicola]
MHPWFPGQRAVLASLFLFPNTVSPGSNRRSGSTVSDVPVTLHSVLFYLSSCRCLVELFFVATLCLLDDVIYRTIPP